MILSCVKVHLISSTTCTLTSRKNKQADAAYEKNTLFTFIGITVIAFYSCKKEPTYEKPITFKFSEQSTLTWKDFRGYYSYTETYAAATVSGIGYKYKERIENGKLILDMDVYSYFDQAESWTKYKEGEPDMLQHEQFHYYVSELQARKLRKHLKEFTFTKEYKDELNSEFCFWIAHLYVMQDQYDEESEHHLNTENQKKWEAKIYKEMEEFSAYSTEKFTIYTNVTMTQSELQFNNSAFSGN